MKKCERALETKFIKMESRMNETVTSGDISPIESQNR